MLLKRGVQAELDLNNAAVTLAKQHGGAARWAYKYGLRRKQAGLLPCRTARPNG
jgi:hypothetical protein